MRRKIQVLSLFTLIIFFLTGVWAWTAPVKKAKTTKELLLIEINALQQDVAKDRWSSAWTRSVRIAAYWAHYRHTHPGLKKGIVDRFAKSHRNLQAHLRRRDKIRIYYELGVLRALVIFLKA